MMKLDEIEAKLNKPIGLDMSEDLIAEMPLLIRAMRQLMVERKVYQALFEAVDNDFELIQAQAPEVYDAYDAITGTPEPEDDVLELIALP